MKKINLGCGTDIKKDYLNVDFFKEKGIDLVFDLNKTPYPFEANQFDEIRMWCILEHLNNPVKVMEEVYRISKNNAKIIIGTSHFSSACAWGDLTHVRPYSYFSFEPYNVLSKREGSSFEFKRKMRFIVKSHFIFNRFYRYTGMSFLANAFPNAYEKLFAFFFPCAGLSFELEVKK